MPDDLTFGVRMDGSGSLASEAKTARDEIVNLKGATDDLTGAAARNADAIARNEAYTRQYKLAIEETRAAHERAAGQLYVVNDAYLKAAEGAKQSAIGNAGATRELMVLGHEAMTGNFSRMPGTLMVLANRSGLAASGMLGMAAAIAAPVIALGALAVAIHEGAKEEEEMNRALAMTGDYAGQTAGSMRAMAAQVSSTSSLTVGNATSMATAFAATGKIGAGAFQNVMDASAAYARASGEDVSKVTSRMIKMFSDPAKAAVELNDKMHFLSVEELNRIQNLQETNHLTEAQNLLATAVEVHLDTQVVKLSASSRAWDEIKKASSGAWAAMKGIGQSDDVERRIKDLQASFTRNLENGNATNAAFFASEIAKAQAQQAKEATDAQAKATFAASNAEDVYAESVRKAQDPLRGRIKLTQDLAVLQDNFRKNAESWSVEEAAAAERSIQNVQKQIAAIDTPKKKDDGSAKRLAAQLEDEKIYFAQVAAAEAAFDKTAEARETKRFADESIAWQKRYEKAQQEHKWQIGEEEAFQAALGKIITGHSERQARDAAAEVEAERKKAEAKAKHMADAMNSEKNFFDKIHVMAADSGAFGLAREKLRYDRELLALDVEHKKTAAAVALDHALSLEEEAAYLQAKENLEVTYKARTSEGTKTFGVSLVQFENQTTVERIQTLATGLTNMTAIGAQKNRALFEINKRAAEVNAIVSGRQAVQDSYKFGAQWGGPWGGAAMAAIAIAATAANVAAIQSTSFGGGGGISSVGGGGGIPSLATSPGVPVSVQSNNSSTSPPALGQSAPAPQQINLTIVGNDKSVFTYDQVVNQLIPMLGQAAGNGVNIKVTMA